MSWIVVNGYGTPVVCNSKTGARCFIHPRNSRTINKTINTAQEAADALNKGQVILSFFPETTHEITWPDGENHTEDIKVLQEFYDNYIEKKNILTSSMLSEIRTLRHMLETISENNKIERMGIENRLQRLEAGLDPDYE